MQINAITSLKNIHQNLSAIVKVNNLHDSTDIDTILDYHDLVQDLLDDLFCKIEKEKKSREESIREAYEEDCYINDLAYQHYQKTINE